MCSPAVLHYLIPGRGLLSSTGSWRHIVLRRRLRDNFFTGQAVYFIVKESPLIILRPEGLDIMLLGSVHMLSRSVPLILREIERFAPSFVALELTDPGRTTGSKDIDAAKERFRGQIIPLDRPPEITSGRYMCNTPPSAYLKESLRRHARMPLNQASILAFNYLNRLYRMLLGDRFYTFGWPEEEERRFIFERDEYMAAKLIDHMRSRRARGYRDRYAVVVGRRHVAGMAAILEAYAVTGDAGSYYAGGRVIDVFSIARLDRPYDVSLEEATHNLQWNRFIESLARTVCLPVYMAVLFLASAAVIAMIAIAVMTLSNR